MFIHELPEFIPEVVGIGPQYKATIKDRSGALTPLFVKERADSDVSAQKADRWFLANLLALYGRQKFPRGNLDAGRLNRLFGRELVPVETDLFDATSGETELRIEFSECLAYLNVMN